jgi:putative ABC transport system ATP-binding protein
MSRSHPQQAIIQLKDVYKHFSVGEDRIDVLEGVDLEVRAGTFLAIVGASGNGKSTLLNMATGIDRPSRGAVVVNGRALHEMSEDQLAVWRGHNVGIVFQFFQLLPGLNLLQNIVLPMDLAGKIPRRERRARAMHLLEAVSLADQARKLPGTVSGGQQQRAAIARALANDPPLIVADEPTGNLDTKTSEAVLHIFDRLHGAGKTLLMVTHSPDLARRAERIVEVANGQIVRDASPQHRDYRSANGSPRALTRISDGRPVV